MQLLPQTDIRARSLAVNLILLVMAGGLGCLSLLFGYVPYGLGDVLPATVGRGEPEVVTIVQNLRLPRTLLALLIGAAMGLSGAVLQGLLRNPLAEPGVVGVTASASLGGVIALYFGLSATLPYALPVMAMAGAGVCTTVLYAIARRDSSNLMLILAGVAISSLCMALTSLAMNLSPNPWAVSEMVFWLLGSVKDRSFTDVSLSAPFIALGCLSLLASARALDALTLGEDGAESLGFDLRWVRIIVVIGTSLAVGASVAVAGGISFIGLVVPHLLRPFVGNLPSRLLLPSMLGGAVLLLASDIVIRLISESTELHLGVVTSLMGAPFFLYLILSRKGRAT